QKYLFAESFKKTTNKFCDGWSYFFPVARPPPIAWQTLMFILQAQGPGMVVYALELPFPEIALPTGFASLLFGHGRDPDQGQFRLLTIQIAAQAAAQCSCIQPVTGLIAEWSY